MDEERGATASVLIPAHNEESTITRCLRALLDDAEPGEFEIVVVANGCTDRTSELVRQFGGTVALVELPEGNKPAALNAGEQVLGAFPRLYVDADVELPTRTARRLVTALSVPEARLCVPRRRLRLNNTSLLVQWYFTVWQELQNARGGLLGSGVYALNEKARERFDEFPNVIADDYFVHNLFRRCEKIQAECAATVTPPAHLRDLMAVRSRILVGNALSSPGNTPADPRYSLTSFGKSLRALLQPRILRLTPAYIILTAAIRIKARRRLRRRDVTWSRADRSPS